MSVKKFIYLLGKYYNIDHIKCIKHFKTVKDTVIEKKGWLFDDFKSIDHGPCFKITMYRGYEYVLGKYLPKHHKKLKIFKKTNLDQYNSIKNLVGDSKIL